jgi:type I restriction enzyme S subunit
VLLERILAERKRRHEEANGKKKYKPPLEPETGGLPEGWAWASMDSLLMDIEAGRSFQCNPSPPSCDDVGIVKVSAVTWGTYDENEAKTVDDPAMVNPAYFINPGDLLFSRANTIDLVGACVIAGKVTRRTMLSDKILRLCTVDTSWNRWLLTVLRSVHGREQIESLATGNQESMRNIGQDRIRRIVVPVPPEAERTRISSEVERRLSVLDALAQTITRNLARCTHLRQSILKRAFSGKLVPQDPNDEPAAALLARIQSQTI